MNRPSLLARIAAAVKRSPAALGVAPAIAVLVVSLLAVAALTTASDDATPATASAASAAPTDTGGDDDTTPSSGASTGTGQFEGAAALEPELTGPRGVITAGHGATPPAPSTPGVAPVALDPVEGPEPVAPPVSEPSDVDILEGPGSGTSTEAAAGSPCQLGCITRATLHRELRSTDIRLRMETSIKTRMWVGVFEEAPLWINGSPVVGDAITRIVHLPRTTWEPTITGLDANTTYHVIIRARDGQGNDHYESTNITTVTPVEVADTLTATPSGCLYQCIESGVVAAITHEAALLQVQTSAPTTLGVWVSTSEPGWIGGSPILPAAASIAVPVALQSSWNVPVGGLAPETTYHVVVRATDDQGRYSSRVGHFTTPAEPPTLIEVTVRQIHVVYDGDKPSWNPGELTFSWGADYQAWAVRSAEEIHDGTTIEIGEHNSQIMSVDPGAFLPRIMVTALEDDPAKGQCLSGMAPYVTDHPSMNEECGMFTNAAATGLQTADFVASLRSCATYGVIGEGEDDHCGLIVSVEGLGDDYPRFWALVSYRFV